MTSSTIDLSAEQEVTRRLHEWNTSAFGGLFDHLRKRCSIEQKYLDGLRNLLRDGEQRTPCSLESVNDVWQCDLQLLREEVDIREQRLAIIKKNYEDLRAQEVLRQRSSEALYNSLGDNIMRYEHSNRTALIAFNNLPLVPPTPKFSWGRRPTTANTPDHDFDRADASVRRCLYDMNNARLRAKLRFRGYLDEENSTAEGVKALYIKIASLTQDIAQHLNKIGNTLVNEVAKINTHRDSVPRQEWFDNHISTLWISPIVYYNIRYKQLCRYMVFGLPFVSADENVPVYESNPRPYDVARVLVATARSRTNAPPPTQGVRPSPEILHRIEYGWETSWETLPDQYLLPDLDLFQLLAHFFSSLPQPFIQLDQELRAEIAHQFNKTTLWTKPHLETLGRVFGKATSSDEKRLLARLCKLLERHPAECSRIFVKPLFRLEGQDLEFMLFALIQSWRNFHAHSTPRTAPLPLESPDSYTETYRGQDYYYQPSMSPLSADTMMGASTWPQSPVHIRNPNPRHSRKESSDVQLQPTRHFGN